jgi:hypothetical protein
MDFLKNIPDSDETKWQKVVNGLTEAPAKGVKYDSDKPRWELVPFRAMKEVVEVLT